MKIMTQNTPGACGRVFRSIANSPMSLPQLPAVFSALILGIAFLFASSCAPAPDYHIPQKAYSSTPKSTLSVGDKIRVSYAGAPEFNQVYKIPADKKIGLPMVGNVTAAGRTASSLQASLTEMYQPHLTDPTVFVSLDEPAATVYVSGEVLAPGKVSLDRSITALEAVMEVGGFSKLANPKKVYVIRTEGGKENRYVLNLANPLSGFESQAFYLRPYDVVFVERSNW